MALHDQTKGPVMIIAILFIIPLLSIIFQHIITSITFLIGYWIPLVLSYKAITTYNGFDHHHRYWYIVLQRVIFVMLSQSIPAASLLSLQFRLLVLWMFNVMLFCIFMRMNTHFIRTSSSYRKPSDAQKSLSLISQSIEANPSGEEIEIEHTTPLIVSCQPTFAFYHPHAQQRAGGEMVLWRLLHSLSTQYGIATSYNSSLPHESNYNRSGANDLRTLKQSIPSQTPPHHITLFSSVVPQGYANQAIEYDQHRLSARTSDGARDCQDVCPPPPSAQEDISHASSQMVFDLINSLQSSSTATSISLSSQQQQQQPQVDNHSPEQKHSSSSHIADMVSRFIIHETENTFGFSFSHLSIQPSSIGQRSSLSFSSPFHKRLPTHNNQWMDNDNNNRPMDDHTEAVSPSPVTLSIVYLEHTAMGDSSNYPRLTLVLQTINAIFPLLWYFLSAIIQYYIILFLQFRSKKPTTQSTPTQYTVNLPFIVMDTAGYPIISLLCSLCGIPCASYTHYPIISSDMIHRNLHQVPTIYNHVQPSDGKIIDHCNQEQKGLILGKSTPNHSIDAIKHYLLTTKIYAKHYYFNVLFYVYAWLLYKNMFIYVNSSWTFNHIQTLLSIFSPSHRQQQQLPHRQLAERNQEMNECDLNTHHTETKLDILFPPCNILPHPTAMVSTQKQHHQYQHQWISIIHHRLPLFMILGQYRPEKQQMLVIHAFKEMLEQLHDVSIDNSPITLLLVGTLRQEDYPLFQSIQDYINTTTIHITSQGGGEHHTIPLKNHIHCLVNVPLINLRVLMNYTLCGVHAMVDEHFGIGVVELMAACPFTIAHHSGGPGFDIINPAIVYKNGKRMIHDKQSPTQDYQTCIGAVATTKDDYVQAMMDTLILFNTERQQLYSHNRKGLDEHTYEYINIPDYAAGVGSDSDSDSDDNDNDDNNNHTINHITQCQDTNEQHFNHQINPVTPTSTPTTFSLTIFDTINNNARQKAQQLFSFTAFDDNIQHKLIPLIKLAWAQQYPLFALSNNNHPKDE